MLEWGEPLGIGFYPDLAEKADLIARLRALAAPRATIEVRSGEEALLLAAQDALVIVDPDDPRAAVTFFDQNRDHFQEVSATFLLLLLQGGSGEDALGDAPSLASFAREASFEVRRRPTLDEGRAAFEQVHGVGAEEWLRQWRASELADTLENNSILSEALALGDAK